MKAPRNNAQPARTICPQCGQRAEGKATPSYARPVVVYCEHCGHVLAVKPR